MKELLRRLRLSWIVLRTGSIPPEAYSVPMVSEDQRYMLSSTSPEGIRYHFYSSNATEISAVIEEQRVKNYKIIRYFDGKSKDVS